MKAYKISNNGFCRNDFKFEVGKTYEQKGKLEICKNGFHFCKNPDDLFIWHSYNPTKTVIFEVEVLGDVIDDNDKSVTNKLKVLRLISFEEYNELFTKYDFEDKYYFHYKRSDGNEIWKEYDNNGNLIHYQNSKSFEFWQEYDNNGNLIHSKDSNDFEYWQEYDSNGNLIHYKDSDRNEYWY